MEAIVLFKERRVISSIIHVTITAVITHINKTSIEEPIS